MLFYYEQYFSPVNSISQHRDLEMPEGIPAQQKLRQRRYFPVFSMFFFNNPIQQLATFLLIFILLTRYL